jgi:hypothetical protein
MDGVCVVEEDGPSWAHRDFNVMKCRCPRVRLDHRWREGVQDQLDTTRHSQLFKDPVNIVPDGMFLHVESPGNLTVFHAVGDQSNRFLLAVGEKRYAVEIVQVDRLALAQTLALRDEKRSRDKLHRSSANFWVLVPGVAIV